MGRFALIFLALIWAGQGNASEALVKFSAPEPGTIRVQRIEGSQIISDIFVGLSNDTIEMPEGKYRVQFVRTDVTPIAVEFADIEISSDKVTALPIIEIPLSSTILGNKTVSASRLTPQIQSSGSIFVVNSQSSLVDGPITTNVSPVTWNTAWFEEDEDSGETRVELFSHPSGAEVWIDGKRWVKRTDTVLILPRKTQALFPTSVIIRMRGFANKIVRVNNDEDFTRKEIHLKEAK